MFLNPILWGPKEGAWNQGAGAVFLGVCFFLMAPASFRLHVSAHHGVVGRVLPAEALLNEDLAFDAGDLYGFGHVQCKGGVWDGRL